MPSGKSPPERHPASLAARRRAADGISARHHGLLPRRGGRTPCTVRHHRLGATRPPPATPARGPGCGPLPRRGGKTPCTVRITAWAPSRPPGDVRRPERGLSRPESERVGRMPCPTRRIRSGISPAAGTHGRPKIGDTTNFLPDSRGQGSDARNPCPEHPASLESARRRAPDGLSACHPGPRPLAPHGGSFPGACSGSVPLPVILPN